jgi:NTE family protein
LGHAMKTIGLALGGGGARGLCHIDFCMALDEMGLKPSIISGTSIGSIIGGFYAAGVSGIEMEEILNQIGLREISKMVDFSILNPSGLVKGRGVTDFLGKHLPVKTFEELPIPLKVTATDFYRREEVIFSSGELIPAIRASISVPAIFRPVKIGHRVLIDGGAVNPLPFDIIRNDCDILIAIDVSGTSAPSKGHSVPSMFESIMTTFHIMENALLEKKMQMIQPDIYIKPVLENIQVLDFYKDEQIRSSAKPDVARLKKELHALLNRPKSIKKRRRSVFSFR